MLKIDHQSLALHETMDVHEILTFKTVSMTKSKTMQILVTDETLKALMQKNVEQCTQAITELQNLLSRTQFQQ